MRILFACHRLPYPPNRGGKIRPFHMIQHLGQKHSVVVASLAHSEEEMEQGAGLGQFCEQVLAEVLPSPTRWMQAVAALPQSTPSSVAYFRSSRLQERVQQTGQRTRFDLVMVHCAFAAQYVSRLSGAIRILDFGDLDSAKWFAYARHRPFPFSLGYRLESGKLRSYERKLAAQSDYCTVTTEGERKEFETLGVAAPCRVIPNGVDCDYFAPRSVARSGSRVIAFLGRMDYFPNIDAVVHFSKAIFPIIRRSLPDAELRIVGSNPTGTVRDLSRIPGITVTGYLPDVRPAVEDVAVAVVPLRIARGTQNKVLEFMAMGIPVVVTPEASQGIQAVVGRDLLVASQPEEFAQKTVAVMQDGRLRAALSASGRRQVEMAHSWPASMKILDSVLEEAGTAAARSSADMRPAATR